MDTTTALPAGVTISKYFTSGHFIEPLTAILQRLSAMGVRIHLGEMEKGGPCFRGDQSSMGYGLTGTTKPHLTPTGPVDHGFFTPTGPVDHGFLTPTGPVDRGFFTPTGPVDRVTPEKPCSALSEVTVMVTWSSEVYCEVAQHTLKTVPLPDGFSGYRRCNGTADVRRDDVHQTVPTTTLIFPTPLFYDILRCYQATEIYGEWTANDLFELHYQKELEHQQVLFRMDDDDEYSYGYTDRNAEINSRAYDGLDRALFQRVVIANSTEDKLAAQTADMDFYKHFDSRLCWVVETFYQYQVNVIAVTLAENLDQIMAWITQTKGTQ
jgi:hypothetical protein